MKVVVKQGERLHIVFRDTAADNQLTASFDLEFTDSYIAIWDRQKPVGKNTVFYVKRD